MFLRQLSFRPRYHPGGLSFCPPAPPPPPRRPWWSARGFPPWPPHPPHPRPHPPCQFFSYRTANPQNFCPDPFGPSRHPFHTAAVAMREHQDREPPHKRRKSTETETRSEWERCRGGGDPGMTAQGEEGGRRREASGNRTSSWQTHQSEDGGKTRDGKWDYRRENRRDRDFERTRSGSREPGGSGTHTGGAQRQPGTLSGGGGGGGGGSPQEAFPPLPSHGAAHPHSSKLPTPPGSYPPPRQTDRQMPARDLHRQWEPSSACSTHLQPARVSVGTFDFTVLSYNILSQELLNDNNYLYRHCDPGVLLWDYRLRNLLAEMQNYNADILCLQEVQEDHYENQIKPALQALGYQCEFKKRTGRKPDGCAVVFRTSRLSLLSSNPIEYFRPGDALLDRDNVGLVLLLKPNDAAGQSDPSACICVANTHLLYNPRRGDIKLAQLAILLAEIGRLSRLPDGSNNPVVLCGDFNSTPWSPLYSFLTTGCLEYKGLPIGMVSGQDSGSRGQRLLTVPIWSQSLGINQKCQYENQSTDTPTGVEGAISNLTVRTDLTEDLATKAAAAFHRAQIEHSLKLQSSYQHYLLHDGRPEITTCHSRAAMTVDYILYTPDSASLPGGRGLQLLGRLSLVGHSELMEVDGLPNQHHSSDHLPLLAHFRLRL
ncbi:protein angel homolog 2 isoform X2 [Genypterus blacodes]